jgi:tRNA uridine 5-carboxymethylaminomethyl modification enzyme
VFLSRKSRYDSNLAALESTVLRNTAGNSVTATQLLRQPEVLLSQLFKAKAVALDIRDDLAELDLMSVETAVKYSGYLRRQNAEIERAKKNERRRIPKEFPFEQVPGLSREVAQRLSQVHPDTLAHALRIPGVTPAAIAVLSAYIGRFAAQQRAEDPPS